jgi:hypothetical protein
LTQKVLAFRYQREKSHRHNNDLFNREIIWHHDHGVHFRWRHRARGFRVAEVVRDYALTEREQAPGDSNSAFDEDPGSH